MAASPPLASLLFSKSAFPVYKVYSLLFAFPIKYDGADNLLYCPFKISASATAPTHVFRSLAASKCSPNWRDIAQRGNHADSATDEDANMLLFHRSFLFLPLPGQSRLPAIYRHLRPCPTQLLPYRHKREGPKQRSRWVLPSER